ncbi:MAG TPA: ComEC/Rec2 family competence protein [Acidimicrobiia bacterium]|jgi:competence protein ComEC
MTSRFRDALGLDTRTLAAVAVGAVTWASAAAARWWGGAALVVALACAAVAIGAIGWRPLTAVCAVAALAGWWSGHGATVRQEAILAYETPPGQVAMRVRLLGDPRQSEYGWFALAVPDPPEPGRPPKIPMLITSGGSLPGVAGDRLTIGGRRTGRRGTVRGDPYSGVVRVGEVAGVESPTAWWWVAGNGARARVLDRLEGRGPVRALLAGFLVGETTGVPEADMEALRRAGLAHLVAVSGSNVSLFLTITVIALGPLGAGPRRRAAFGLAALVVLVIATRWEPSVIRASIMAALLLGGRVLGWALTTPTALSVTVTLVVLTSGELATEVGFAMSVLATAGVLVGASFRPTALPRPMATVLSATCGAQLAVAPVAIATFGTIPLLAPLTNVVAIPIVSAASAVGGLGVALAAEPLVDLAAVGAGTVLAIARVAASWPQVGWAGLACAVVAVTLLHTRWRPAVAVAVACAAAWTVLAPSASLPRPGAVFFDVGQGDAVLIVSGEGRTMLVDGGPDPTVLDRKLAAYGVGRLDLVVLTHVHADHATGLEAVFGRRRVGEVWLPSPPHETSASKRVADMVRRLGIPWRHAPVGEMLSFDDLAIEVVGPLRRYASPNDQSVVMRVHGPDGTRVLLTGDIETHAQADLAGLSAEVLKVPHQGAATSDLDWLTSVGARRAIISVGPNDFGHPAPEVIASLEAAGAMVHRTDEDGDAVIDLAAGGGWGPGGVDSTIDVEGPTAETPVHVPRRAEGG